MCVSAHVLGTLTVLTSLLESPLVCSYSEANNNHQCFLEFILDCCLDGDLTAGDYLILDNAPVHTGCGSQILKCVFDFFGVNLVFIPAYSPELNPCELVFSVVKQHSQLP
jgi:hypothetical protein